MRGLDRHIGKELTLLYVACFGLVLVAFMAIDSVSEVSKRVAGLGLSSLLHYLGLRAIAFQSYVVPLAVLLSVLLCYSRMTREGEVLGLEVSGIGRRRVALPGLIFALVWGVLSFLCQERISMGAAQRGALMVSQLQQVDGPIFKGISSDPEIMPDGRERLLVAHSLDLGHQRLHGLFLHYFFEGRRSEEIYAESASWGERGWTLTNVRRLQFDPYQERSKETQIAEMSTVANFLGAIPQPNSLLAGKRALQSYSALRERLRLMPDGAESLRQERRLLQLEMQQRLALPMAGFVFALVAIPFGYRSREHGFGYCLAATVAMAMAYFVATSFALSFGESGALSPLVSAWITSCCFAALGTGMLMRES